MVLEATLVCLDNSEWMRNGDYTPSRLEAQNDAVGIICGAKTQANPENTIGVMTAGSKRPEVLVTLTQDVGKILHAIHAIPISGTLHFSDSIQIACLVLKHRPNKMQRQRIVVFVGSPIEEDEKSLVRLAKRLKKNNVSVDVVNFGEEAENTAKLEAFIGALNANDTSHLVTIPPGPHILSDILVSSPILSEDGVPPMSGGAGFEFGVDPNIDPELALALRMSMEEERQRQERLSGGDQPPSSSSSSSAPAAAPSSTGAAAPAGGAEMMDTSGQGAFEGEDDEDAMLAQAIAMSMAESMGGGQVSDQEKMQRALEAAEMEVDQNALGEMLQNPELLSSIMGSLPGVDPNDPRLKNLLQEMQEGKKEGEEDKKGEEKKDQDKDQQ